MKTDFDKQMPQVVGAVGLPPASGEECSCDLVISRTAQGLALDNLPPDVERRLEEFSDGDKKLIATIIACYHQKLRQLDGTYH